MQEPPKQESLGQFAQAHKLLNEKDDDDDDYEDEEPYIEDDPNEDEDSNESEIYRNLTKHKANQ